MRDLRWRTNAKNILYCYFSNVQQLHEVENDVLLRSRSMRDQRFPQGSTVDNTALGVIALSRGEAEYLRRSVQAVRLLLGRLSTGRRVDLDRLELLKLIYFRAETSLYGAAIRLDISERTAKRWNDQALRFIAEHMGWLQEEKPGMNMPGKKDAAKAELTC
ncbi:MAG: hypothetical protein Q4B50_06855 [Bacillota bacterium]|nr:hypothetical protein [Bacillota bacterium]